jgi:hypothetical protein
MASIFVDQRSKKSKKTKKLSSKNITSHLGTGGRKDKTLSSSKSLASMLYSTNMLRKDDKRAGVVITKSPPRTTFGSGRQWMKNDMNGEISMKKSSVPTLTWATANNSLKIPSSE